MIPERKKFAEALVWGKTPYEAAIHAGYTGDDIAAAVERLSEDPEVKDFVARHKAARPEFKLPPLPGETEVLGAIPSSNGDPKKMLKAVMDNPHVDLAKRMDAAKTLMPFEYAKLGELGKKEKQQAAAEEASGSTGNKFATRKQPNLQAVK